MLDPNTNGGNPAQDTFLLDGGGLVLEESTVTDVRYEDGGSVKGGTGVTVYGPAENVEIRNNEFTSVAKPISLQAYRDFDNTPGIISDVVVESNTIRNQFQAVDVFSNRNLAGTEDTVVRNLTFVDNVIKDGNTGLAAWTGNVVDSQITNNVFENNSVQVYQPRGTFDGAQILSSNDLDGAVYIGPPNTSIHTSIQATLDGALYDEDAAAEGDTVHIHAGIYEESVNVDTDNLVVLTTPNGVSASQVFTH